MTKRPVDETVVARKAISPPHADTALCKFLTKQIAALSGVKSQREIAAEVGYDRSNIISMIKNGDTALPLDKVPAFAKALDVDPKHLFRLALEQNHPEIARVAHEIFGNVVTDNEMALVRMFREVTGDRDLKPEAVLLKSIEDAFKMKRRLG
ncbi:helix-turn-helix domain-containing protein [Methylocystis sp.]|uniref:helix-turn-helix domain-containing protein n=1 Tax=Methylocystis sp. TaxID=1911079 RepID=UPI003D0F25E4